MINKIPDLYLPSNPYGRHVYKRISLSGMLDVYLGRGKKNMTATSTVSHLKNQQILKFLVVRLLLFT